MSEIRGEVSWCNQKLEIEQKSLQPDKSGPGEEKREKDNIYENPFGIVFCRSRPSPARLYNSFVYVL